MIVLFALLTALLPAATVTVQGTFPKGHPAWHDMQLDAQFRPDSVRVRAAGALIPSKVEWRVPHARVSWRSTGAASYTITYNEETGRMVEPAMIGTGDRMTFGRLGVRGKLSVGLWAHPVAVDLDRDGALDLIVSCADRPYNGIYYFRNIGSNEKPMFDRAEWMGPGKPDLVAADFNGDGAVDLVYRGGFFSDVVRNRLSKPVAFPFERDYHVGRDDLWYPVDWDGDGKIDALNGTSDWREYGWDDAYDSTGKWLRGPLHGFVYFYKNTGAGFAKPVKLPVDQYGAPVPNPVDWDNDGKLDLIAANFIDTVFFLRNNGNGFDKPAPLFKLDLCMIQPRVVRWHKDGRPSIIVGEEDGRVAFAENLSPKGQQPRLAPLRYFEQIDPYIKSGALSRPVAVDWNGDGKLDLIAGNSAGYVQYFENTGTKQDAQFADRGYFHAAGKPIRRIAGPNGSVQGPAEEKWGYSNPSVADWDMDGKLDIIVNDIWGDVLWYRGTGNPINLAAAQSVEVEWQGKPPKPDWVWWEPKPKQLLTQWRTTPKVVDWDRDGLPDLVMLNHQGYLSLFRRSRCGAKLCLNPPERIFVQASGRFLNLANGRAGGSGRRKIDVADWDGDGDMDLICDSDEGPALYENIGTQVKPVMQPRGAIIKTTTLRGHSPTPNVADWNGDGKLDVIVGAEDGFFYFFDRNYIEASRR